VNDHPIRGVSRSKNSARRFYDRLSRRYDLLAEGSERRAREIGLSLLSPSKGEAVLEIGSGTGLSLLALAHAVGPLGKVYGVDLSEGMISVARQRAAEETLSSVIRLVGGDGARLPFAGGIFGSLLMSFTLELFDTPEIPDVLRECHRVLRDGGRLCVVAMARRYRRNLWVRIYEWAHNTFPAYLDCRPIPVERLIREAGFRVVTVRGLSMWGLPVDVVLAQA